jgi:chromosome segregation ATPase
MDELEARRRKTGAGASEAEELRGRVKALRRAQRALEDEIEGAGESARHWRQEAQILVRRAEVFEGEARRRGEELEAARRSLAREQRRVAAASERGKRLERSRAEERQARREAERARKELERRLAKAERRLRQAAAAADVVERTAASRSWRFGHGTMKLLRRLSFRPPAAREDALESAAGDLREALGEAAPTKPANED